MNRLLQRLTISGRHRDDSERDRRTSLVMALVERFVFDIGMLAAGRESDIESYVAPEVAARVRTAMRPGLSAGLITRPDFGEYAQVRIQGDLLDGDATVCAEVEFDDRSVRVDEGGRTVVRLRRRIRVLLLIDPPITRVLDHRLEIV